MEQCNDWVWCDVEGDLHVNRPDPYMYGPVLDMDPPIELGWELREDPDYTGTLWHYTCPGPHRRVWIGKEVK